MNIIFLLIPMAIAVIVIAGYIFFWAVKSDQFEDLERHGSNILFDEDVPQHSQSEKENNDVSPK